MEKEQMTSGKEKSHHGDNLILARKWKKMTQADVADKIGIHQTEISTLEKQETIDEVLLERIAEAMDIPVSFFTDFDLDDAVKNYYNNSSYVVNDEAHVNQIIQGDEIIEGDVNNNYPLEEVQELTDKFLKLQKELLEKNHHLDKENALLKQELEFLKKKK